MALILKAGDNMALKKEGGDLELSVINYYRGAFDGPDSYPSDGAVGQWLIDSQSADIRLFGEGAQDWVSTGISANSTPFGQATDYPFRYVYSSLDGSGYGFESAYPSANWTNTPDGKLQAEGYSSDILSRRIKFATLKNPGDEVTIQAGDNAGAFNRFTVIGLTAGTDADSLSWKVSGQPSSGTAWMMTDAADRDTVELYSAYIEPYWGGTSYGYNFTGRSNSSNLEGMAGNQGEKQITYRMGDDYRVEMYIDGHFFVKNINAPQSGVDLYITIYGNTGRIFEQPTGNGANFIGGTAPSTTGARYFMSAVATPATATELAQGGGHFLYSDTEAGDASDVELDDAEAGAARFCRVFVDYSGMTLAERSDSTYPVVLQDQRALDQVQYLARGYFHSLDLELPEIQSKMELYADALNAATAGSVEVTLALLQSLQVPSASGGALEAFDPWHVTYSPTGTCDTRAFFYTGSTLRDEYGITGARFWTNGTTIAQMEFYFASTADSVAWRSQDRVITFDVGGVLGYVYGDVSDDALDFEGSYTVTTADQAYASGSQVTYSNPDSWNIAKCVELAHHTYNNFSDPGIQIAAGTSSPESPASALGESEVVSELIGNLQNHLQKFPR